MCACVSVKGGEREGGRERMCIYVVVGAREEHCNLAVCACVCMCACVCECEREREREKESEGDIV